MLGDVEVKDAPAIVGEDEEDVKDAKGGGGDGEEVNGGELADVVVDEGPVVPENSVRVRERRREMHRRPCWPC